MTDQEQSRDAIKRKAFHRFGIVIVAILMILFGLAEIATGFRMTFLEFLRLAAHFLITPMLALALFTLLRAF